MDPIAIALANLTDDDLAALTTTVAALMPGPSPNLLEWIGIQADRERHRRIGVVSPDLPLDEAIQPGEANAATALAMALRDATPPGAVRDLFDAVIDRLTAGARH